MAHEAESELQVRPVRFQDLDSIRQLISPLVQQGILLPRTEGELFELLPTSFVAWDGDQVVGFCALEIYSIKLAEVRSLVVAPEYRARGVGRQLVSACVDLARRTRVLEVMAITSNEAFFRTCGFDFTLPGEKKALFIQTRDDPNQSAVDLEADPESP
ncbi:MAG: GNAT family N-acetyltransferase [Planctomycetota bacterium]